MFYVQLQKLCKERGEKLTPLCKKLGLSTSGVGSWQAGVLPNAKTLIIFSEYFGVTTDYLLGLSEQKNNFILLKSEGKNKMLEKNYEDWTWIELKNELRGLRNRYNISNDESLEKICSEIDIPKKSWIHIEFWSEKNSLKDALMEEYEMSDDDRTISEITEYNQFFFDDYKRKYLIEDYKKIIRHFVNLEINVSASNKKNNSTKSEDNNMQKIREIVLLLLKQSYGSISIKNFKDSKFFYNTGYLTDSQYKDKYIEELETLCKEGFVAKTIVDKEELYILTKKGKDYIQLDDSKINNIVSKEEFNELKENQNEILRILKKLKLDDTETGNLIDKRIGDVKK